MNWKWFASCALLAVAAAAKPMEMSLDKWEGDPLSWHERDNGFSCDIRGTLIRMDAPLSEDGEIETVVIADRHEGTNYAVAGAGLHLDGSNFYHVALVEGPPKQGGAHFIEMHQMHKGAWPMNDNLQVLDRQELDNNWIFGVPYRVRLEKKKDVLKGTVTALDGRLLFSQTMKFKDDTPVNFVRPFLNVNNMRCRYFDIQADWSGQTQPDAAPPTFPPYNGTSFVPGRSIEPTGFFSVRQDPDGRWWAYDPLGRGFVVFGIDHVGYNGHYCEKTNRFYYGENNDKKYASRAEWEENTLRRLKEWGFNMFLSSGDHPLAMRGLANAPMLAIATNMASLDEEYYIAPFEEIPCSAFPNVFHPLFRKWCAYTIRKSCARQVDNPWIFGYFIDNELAWWGRSDRTTGLFDLAMQRSAGHTAKIAIRDLLMAKAGGDLATLNRTWGLTLKSADEILSMKALPNDTDEQKDIKLEFLKMATELFFRTVREEFKKVDPNHLLMGCRFAGVWGNHSAVWEIAGKYSDVITINYYGDVDLDAEAAVVELTTGYDIDKRRPLSADFNPLNEWTKRPILITEWSFPALDAGLPSSYGAGQRFKTQAERAKATEIFARTVLSYPYVIGYDYFMWVDQPPLGITHVFPENSNYGIVNLKDEPYPLMTKMFTYLHHHQEEARLATIPPLKPLKPREHRLHDEFLSGRPVTAVAPETWHLQQKSPTEFSCDSGRYHVTARPDDPCLVIEADGKPLTRFCALLQYEKPDKGCLWNDVNELLKADINPAKEQLTITLTARYNPRNDLEKPFEMTYRLVFPAGEDFMLADIVNICNTGTSDINVRGVFLRFFPNFDNRPEVETDTRLQLSPRVWNAPKVNGWLAPDSSRYLAFACEERSPMVLRPWYFEENGSYHPDLAYYLKEPFVLKPGDVYVPDIRMYLMAFYGEGDLHDAQLRAFSLWR